MPGVELKEKVKVVRKADLMDNLIAVGKAAVVVTTLDRSNEPTPSQGLPRGQCWKETKDLVAVPVHKFEALIGELELRVKLLKSIMK